MEREKKPSDLPPPGFSRMADLPPRNLGHRRAHSEILSLPDDITFDGDDDLLSMYMDMEKFETVETLGFPGETTEPDRPRFRHQHSQSVDGSTDSLNSEQFSPGPEETSSSAETKKAISAAKLADLAHVDPKRAKRIWANRQSAARSKERKMRYIAELERKVQTLQTEATTLSAQLTMLQRDTSSLSSENSELKLRLQTMEQQVHLQDTLNDTLREEVRRLKFVTGQASIANGGLSPSPSSSSSSPFGVGPLQPPYQSNQVMQPMMAAQHLQQLQIHSRPNTFPHPHNSYHHPQLQSQRQLGSDVKVRAPSQGFPHKERDGSPEASSSSASR